MWLFPWCQMALVSGRCYLLLPECFSACFSKTIFGLAQHAFVWDHGWFFFFPSSFGCGGSKMQRIKLLSLAITHGRAQLVDLRLLVELRKRIRSL